MARTGPTKTQMRAVAFAGSAHARERCYRQRDCSRKCIPPMSTAVNYLVTADVYVVGQKSIIQRVRGITTGSQVHHIRPGMDTSRTSNECKIGCVRVSIGLSGNNKGNRNDHIRQYPSWAKRQTRALNVNETIGCNYVIRVAG